MTRNNSPESQRRILYILSRILEIKRGFASLMRRTIDANNILQATHQAMNEALAQLEPAATARLVDWKPVKTCKCRRPRS